MTCINISRTAAILALTLGGIVSGCSSTPVARGVVGNQLGTCLSSPNCVSTRNADEGHRIDPLHFEGDAASAKSKLNAVLQARSDTKLIEDSGNYVRVEFTTAIMRFVDDGEFLIQDGKIDVRSGSRVGYSDLGKNRSRMEEIRAAFEPCCN